MNQKALHYKRLLREYDMKRSKSAAQQANRLKEVYEKIPQIEKIDKTLNNSGVKLVRHMLKGGSEADINTFRQNTDELNLTKKMLLVEAGFSPDYLEQHYECSLCKDTGFLEDKPCTCFKQGLINIAYEQSNLKHILSVENFEHFSLKYYSKEINPKTGRSPYNTMQQIYQVAVGLVDKFDTEKENLLLHGQTGLGKTFLCNCIAKELLDRGNTVLYFTAPQLFKLFEESRFHRDDLEDLERDMLSTLYTVDLLIIDDLGTESCTTLTVSDLFDVINTRYLNQTSTIISTNLLPNDWKDRYSERIISRVFGNYISLKFMGSDIRLQKKYSPK